MSALPPTTSNLRRLFGAAGTLTRARALVIVIPGIGTPAPTLWQLDNGPNWLRALDLPAGNPVATYSYQYTFSTDSTLVWSVVEETANTLFEEVSYLLDHQERSTECPLVFVAHSLGGIILKRAICLAHNKHEHSSLLPRTASAVLLSTPHFGKVTAEHREQTTNILKHYAKLRPKNDGFDDIAEHIAADCRSFETAFRSHDLTVLSCYEERETRTRRMQFNKTILVDKKLATTGIDKEQLVGLAADHSHTCLLGDAALQRVAAFMNVSIDERRQYLLERGTLSEFDPPPIGSSIARTISSSSLPLEHGTLSSGLEPRLTLTQSRERSTVPSTAPVPEGRTSLSSSAPQYLEPRLPCFWVPYERNPEFFGRSWELAAINGALQPRSSVPDGNNDAFSTVRSFALHGVGGIGKTQVAAEYVYKFRSQYEAIMWVHARARENIAQSFMRIAVELGLVKEESVEAKDRILTRDLVLGWLSKPIRSYINRENEPVNEVPWLLVFDNVDDPTVVGEFWPHNASGSVLLTSRDPLAGSHFYSATAGLKLAVFNPMQSAEFLLKMARRDREDEEESAINATAEILGGIPLAIAQMAGAILRKDITFAEFVESYKGDESSREALFQLRIGDGRSKYEHTIASVWSLENLEHGGNLLDVLSFFDCDSIPERLVRGNTTLTDMPGFPMSDEDYERARTELLSSSLVTRNRQAKTLSVHRLISDAVRSKMREGRYSQVLTSALQLMSGAWPYKEGFVFMNEKFHWTRCHELWPHILCIRGHFGRLVPPRTISKQHLEPSKVLLEAAWYSIMIANFSVTMELLDAAKTFWQSLDSDRQRLAQEDESVREEFEEQTRLIELYPGVLGLHVNDRNMAIKHCKRYLDMLQQKLGDFPTGKDQRMAVAWNELGNAYLHNDLTVEAESCFKKSMQALDALDHADRNSVFMPLVNLGFAQWMQGRLEDAAKTFGDALQEREATFGRDDDASFATGKLLLGFGNVRFAQQRYDESHQLHRRSLEQYKATLGAHHHRTGDALVHVSDHYLRLSKYDAAKASLDQAARIYGDQKHFGPEKARVCYKRCKVLSLLGDSEAADRDGNEALQLYRHLHPGDTRSLGELSDNDFHKPIIFWSK